MTNDHSISNDPESTLAHMLPRGQLINEELAEIIHQRHWQRLSAEQSYSRRKIISK